MARLEKQNAQLKEVNVALQKNISCLFKTAKEELARKDELIEQLRREAAARRS